MRNKRRYSASGTGTSPRAPQKLVEAVWNGSQTTSASSSTLRRKIPPNSQPLIQAREVVHENLELLVKVFKEYGFPDPAAHRRFRRRRPGAAAAVHQRLLRSLAERPRRCRPEASPCTRSAARMGEERRLRHRRHIHRCSVLCRGRHRQGCRRGPRSAARRQTSGQEHQVRRSWRKP